MWYGVRRHIVSSGVPCQVSVCYGTGTGTMHAMVLNCTYMQGGFNCCSLAAGLRGNGEFERK